MSNRELDQLEAEELLEAIQRTYPTPIDELWPGEINLELIAQAVNNKRSQVTLNGEIFTISYYNQAEAVFVKPDAETFVPCGWFTYKKLKGVLGH